MQDRVRAFGDEMQEPSGALCPPDAAASTPRAKLQNAALGLTQSHTLPTTSSTSGSSTRARKVSTHDIQLVQNLIERCLQLYMPQKEVVQTLQIQAKIEPGFTDLVWQKLEEQNPEFFRSYYTRLKLKDQIVMFNYLLEQQVQVVQKLHRSWLQALPSIMGGRPPGMPMPPLPPMPHGMPMNSQMPGMPLMPMQPMPPYMMMANQQAQQAAMMAPHQQVAVQQLGADAFAVQPGAPIGDLLNNPLNDGGLDINQITADLGLMQSSTQGTGTDYIGQFLSMSVPGPGALGPSGLPQLGLDPASILNSSHNTNQNNNGCNGSAMDALMNLPKAFSFSDLGALDIPQDLDGGLDGLPDGLQENNMSDLQQPFSLDDMTPLDLD